VLLHKKEGGGGLETMNGGARGRSVSTRGRCPFPTLPYTPPPKVLAHLNSNVRFQWVEGCGLRGDLTGSTYKAADRPSRGRMGRWRVCSSERQLALGVLPAEDGPGTYLKVDGETSPSPPSPSPDCGQTQLPSCGGQARSRRRRWRSV